MRDGLSIRDLSDEALALLLVDFVRNSTYARAEQAQLLSISVGELNHLCLWATRVLFPAAEKL